MNCDETRNLFPSDWDGTLSDAESVELATHLANCAPCRESAERLRAVWMSLGSVTFDEPSRSVHNRFYDALAAYGEGQAAASRGASRPIEMPRGGRNWFWQAGLAAAALVVGVAVGYFAKGSGAAASGASEISGLRTEVNGLRQMVALSLLQRDSASDRLRGVTFADQVERSDTQVLGALLDSVSRDPNVNVRIAAADALRTFSLSPEDRVRIVAAISGQSAPMVQIALIDLVADIKDTTAARELRALSEDPTYNPSVRERARWALERLQ